MTLKQKEFGQIWTPEHIVNRMLDDIGCTASNTSIINMRVMEPSFGLGRFIIESDDFHDYAMLIGAPRHDGYRQPSTTWLKNSICEFDNMRSCDIIEYVFSRNNYDKSRHADLHEFNSCDIIELVERTG